MNRNQHSNTTSATQVKNSKALFRLLKKILAMKEMRYFDFASVSHEKLLIIYANIRV